VTRPPSSTSIPAIPRRARPTKPTCRRSKERGLIYPVTFVDDEAVYDGAVSYPGIIRAVENKLGATA